MEQLAEMRCEDSSYRMNINFFEKSITRDAIAEVEWALSSLGFAENFRENLT